MKVLQLCVKPETRYFGLGHLFELGLKTASSLGAEVSQAYLEVHEENLSDLSCDKIKNFQFNKDALKNSAKSIVNRLSEYCMAEDFDVIITHQYKAYHLLQLALQGKKQPLCLSVIHGIGVFSRIRRRFSTLAIKNHPRWHFVAISEAVRRDLEQHLWGVSADRIHVLPNSIDRVYVEKKQIAKVEARQSLGLSTDAFIFGALGRLVPKKGHLTLLKAFKKVSEKKPNAECVIIGDGRLEKELIEEIKVLKLEGKVKILGYVPEAFVYVKAFDVFTMPSLDEGFGIAILEAMAAKLPIIATSAGGIPEVMGQAALIEPGNVKALVSAMLEKASASEKKLCEEGERHYQRLCQQFTSQIYLSRLSKLLLMAPEKQTDAVV